MDWHRYRLGLASCYRIGTVSVLFPQTWWMGDASVVPG